MKDKQDSLFLLDLDQPVMALRQFISSWVLLSDGKAVIIDPGPASTIPRLVKGLKDLGMTEPAAILLTHIHIDHAGGTGDLVEQYPGTPVLCHPKGIPHMADPARLWEGSLKVLGDLARAYGPIKPVPEELLFFSPEAHFQGFDIQVLETPGHAAHHLSFLLGDTLFAGEVLGVHLPAETLYLRPATPPVFRYRDFVRSINSLKEHAFNRICFGHYGTSHKPEEILPAAGGQLEKWVEIVASAKGNRDRAVEEILAKDPLVQAYGSFPQDIQDRERYFIGNSVKGIALSLEQEE
ncbi:MAG: MBL fold metallo-hydrolase [Spirochaetales bacterium]|nr:MBL fold metallo-hydrolase [Spirochaetales bacterium]